MTAARNRRAKRKRAEEDSVAAGESVPRCKECGAIGTRPASEGGGVHALLYDHTESCGVRMAQERMKRHQPPPNEFVREENRGGVPIVGMLRQDLTDAWVAHLKAVREEGDGSDKALATKGRVRGLAQAVATIQSPYSRTQGSKAEWSRYVLRVMNEYRPTKATEL
jgi:hypothetical protein